MIRAEVWPYSLYMELICRIDSVVANGGALEFRNKPGGVVIDARILRGQGSAVIQAVFVITTPVSVVAASVFGEKSGPNIQSGVKILCEGSKFRAFKPCDKDGRIEFDLDLKNLEGAVQIDPVMVLTSGAKAGDMDLAPGTVVATSPDPIWIVIDQSLTGDSLDVDWVDFAEKQCPADAFFHVHLPSSGDETPALWLNARFKNEIEPVLMTSGTASGPAIAGEAMRQLLWNQIWERVVVWALQHENTEEPEWPATRIAEFWRRELERAGITVCDMTSITLPMINEFSLGIQQCRTLGKQLICVGRIGKFCKPCGGAA